MRYMGKTAPAQKSATITQKEYDAPCERYAVYSANGKKVPPPTAIVMKTAAVFVCWAVPRREIAKIMLNAPLSKR